MAKISSAELFPILPQQPTGIARMAALAQHADDGHLIEFKALEVRSILNKSVSKRMRWLWYSTDPYQPIERRAQITRSLLEVFARKSGYRLGIVTKSRLIERDIDLLQEISRCNTLVVHVTITTPDAKLARLLEPRAPRPDLRFQT